MEKDEKGYSPELWQKMADLGWMGLVYPEKYGGSGLTFVDFTTLLEEMGKALVPRALLFHRALRLSYPEMGHRSPEKELPAQNSQRRGDTVPGAD